MELHDSLLSALEKIEGHSGINLYCSEDEADDIRELFIDTFHNEYRKSQNIVESTFGDCSEKEDGYDPIEGVVLGENSVCILIGNLDLHYRNYNNRPIVGRNIITGDDALQAAIDSVKKKNQNIRYEGYIGYLISDAMSGEPYQYELSSEKTIEGGKTYNFLGRALAKAFTDEDFWEELSSQLSFCEQEDFEEIIDCFKAYSEFLQDDTYEKLLDIADEVDEDLRDSLEKYIGW